MAVLARKWQRRPDKRPQEILRAALEVFADKGYRQATMEDVARAAGITKGTIYLYFPSKEALFVSLVRSEFRQALDLLPKIAFEPDQDPEALVKQVALEFMEVLMQPRFTKLMPLVVAHFNHVPALKEMYWTEILPKANIQLAGLLELGMGLGLVRRLDPVIAARCLFGMFFVFIVTQEILGAKAITPMRLEDIVETVVGIYFHGILQKGEGL